MAVGVVVALVVVAVVVVALGARGRNEDRDTAADAPAPTTTPAEWDARIGPIATWVAAERDLAFDRPVEVVLQSDREYLAQAADDPSDVDEDATAELADLVAAMRSVGLVEGDVDLSRASSDLGREGTLASYDPTSETVFVRGDELTPAVRVTVAHELTHVLQDQSFDLSRVADPDFERADELRAVAEGDARRIERAYAEEVLTAAEREMYRAASDSDAEQGEANPAGVAPVLSIVAASPDVLGEGFLSFLDQVDGGDVYDDLLVDPPSEQELLDPTIRGTDRADTVEVAIEAPDGAEVLDEAPFGPLGWYLLLASRGNAGAALDVVDGWGGDASVSYRADGRVCTATAVVGDTPAATDKLYFALTAWAAAGPEGAAEVAAAGDAIEVRACDPGAGAASDSTVSIGLLAVPALRGQVEAQLVTGSDVTEAEARCVGNAVVTELTVEELQGPATPEVTGVVADATRRCAR